MFANGHFCSDLCVEKLSVPVNLFAVLMLMIDTLNRTFKLLNVLQS